MKPDALPPLFNLHTHTTFSDGSAPPEDYILEAIRQGFSVLGFSDHAPIPIPNSFAIQEGEISRYCQTINELKINIFRDQKSTRSPIPAPHESSHPESPNRPIPQPPKILLGLEYDFIPGMTTPISILQETHRFDYIIGSVHLVRNTEHPDVWFIDGPKQESYDRGLREVFSGDIKSAVTTYWRQLQEMISAEQPGIIGHMDKIKMHNHDRFFREDEPWYVSLAGETLELIRETGAVVEVNTRGIYKKRSETLFPGPAILKTILEMGIPVTISSDAHRPEEISYGIREAAKTLQILGFKSQRMLTPEGWREVPLSV